MCLETTHYANLRLSESASLLPSSSSGSEQASTSYSPFAGQQQRREDWARRSASGLEDINSSSPWPASPVLRQFPRQNPMSPMAGSNPGSSYANWNAPWPMLRRTSSEDTRLNQLPEAYYNLEMSSSVSSLQSKSYPQRRSSNRDEFDGPSQLLERPDSNPYEPKEEELPQLPITLYAQEQDEILSKVNDRLSQCAFDFVAKYQFPVPVEPDKRPVRVPNDREWSEWVYLLKRLATKRRIPARVLYNGQIKQLITILENSLEMRHAAKHQSRPLKDDRNILQLISSGLQVAKIVKDAPAMHYLDNLYVSTERLIQGRRATPPPSFGGLGVA